MSFRRGVVRGNIGNLIDNKDLSGEEAFEGEGKRGLASVMRGLIRNNRVLVVIG